MMDSHRRLAVVAGVSCVLALTACGSSKSGSSSSGSGGTVPIGVITSMTGAYSAYGAPFADGVRYAVSQINAKGFMVNGKKYTFNALVEDDNTDPATAVQKATSLISDHHVVAMFGPIGKQGPSVENLTNASHVIMFSSSSSVAPTAGPPKNPLVFMTDGSAATRVDAVVKSIQAFVPNVHKVAILGPNEQTAAAIAPLLDQGFSSANVSVQQFLYPVGTTDLSSVLTRLVAAKPDAVVLGWSSADRQVQAQQFATADLPKTTTLFGYAGAISECKTLMPGRPCLADPLAGADLSNGAHTPQAQQFVTGFEQFTHSSRLSDQIEATMWTYDFPFMLAQAMTKAGTVTDTAAIAKALRQVSRNGLVGDNITFDAQNNAQFGFDVSLVSPDGSISTKHFE